MRYTGEKMRELSELFEMLLHIYLFWIMYKRSRKLNRRRWWVRPVNRDREIKGYFATTYQKLKELDPQDFFLHTRMSRPIYDLVLNLMKDDLRKKSRRPAIDFECRLAVTLSFLSQGVSPTFLAWSFKMGKSTVRNIILDTCDTIWRVLSPVYVCRPSELEYKRIADDFQNRWNMPHCVGAVDGKHIEIQAPPNSGSSFFNYKKSFSIVLLGACDANYTFTDISVDAYGSQSDGGILKESTFGRELFQEVLPIPKECRLPNSTKIFPYYFVGDAAFPLKKNLLRPYPGRNLPEDKTIFNYRLSRARRIIENCFGILVTRWRVLKHSLNLLPKNADKVVLAAVALHNFIKLNDKEKIYVPSNFVDWEDNEHVIHNGEWRQESTNLRSARLGTNNATRSAFNMRDELKEYFLNEGAVSFQWNR